MPPEKTVTFMNMEFLVGPGVLAPRAETELLGSVAIDLLAKGPPDPMVIDMCCGCGNLGIAVANRIPGARVWACDLTPETTAIARANARRFGLEDRVTVVESDMFSALPVDRLAGRTDLVICNPPYISTGRLAGDRAHLLEEEPREAFDGGPYGITFHQRLVREAQPFLKPGGFIAFEFGEGQERQVTALVTRTRAYGPVKLVMDGGGVPRVGFAERL